MNISKRLKTIADFVPDGSKLADIGTDHAYIPTYLAVNTRISFSVASDIAKGPCDAAVNTITKAGCQDKVIVRQADGLQGINAGEVDTVVIAGMGGATIIEILNAGTKVLDKVQNLIIQPMVQAKSVRRWLIDNSWKITNEDLVLEDGHIYQIICAKKMSQVEIMDDLKLEVGGLLMQHRHPLLKQHLENIINHHQNVCDSMQKSNIARQSERYKQLNSLIMQAKEFLKCL